MIFLWLCISTVVVIITTNYQNRMRGLTQPKNLRQQRENQEKRKTKK